MSSALRYTVSGMTCGKCERLISEAVLEVIHKLSDDDESALDPLAVTIAGVKNSPGRKAEGT